MSHGQDDGNRSQPAGSAREPEAVTQVPGLTAIRATTSGDEPALWETRPTPTADDVPQAGGVAFGSTDDRLTATDRQMGRLYRRVEGDGDALDFLVNNPPIATGRPEDIDEELEYLTSSQAEGLRIALANGNATGGFQAFLANQAARRSNISVLGRHSPLTPFVNSRNGKPIADFPLTADMITRLEPDVMHSVMRGVGIDPMGIARWDLDVMLAHTIGVPREFHPEPPVFSQDPADYPEPNDGASSDDDASAFALSASENDSDAFD